MAFKDHFSALASHYAAFRPTYPPALFEYLASLAPQRRLAWDCACGSGQATTALAALFDEVIGTDASAEQISAATAAPRVSYRVAPADRSGLDQSSVDLLTVAQALHWFDLDAFYREADRVLRAGGVLAVWCYGALQVDGPEVDAVIQSFYHEVVGPYWPPERRFVHEGYSSLPFPYPLIAPTPAFAMEAHWALPHLMGYLRSWSATGQYFKQHSQDPVVEVEKQITPHWGDPARPRRVTWPLSLRIGRKSQERG